MGTAEISRTSFILKAFIAACNPLLCATQPELRHAPLCAKHALPVRTMAACHGLQAASMPMSLVLLCLHPHQLAHNCCCLPIFMCAAIYTSSLAQIELPFFELLVDALLEAGFCHPASAPRQHLMRNVMCTTTGLSTLLPHDQSACAMQLVVWQHSRKSS